MTVDVTVQESVARIDLNRPERGNALTAPMLEELTRMLARYGSSANTNVVVLTAQGPQFCSGRDTTGERAPAASAHALRTGLVATILALYRTVAELPVPVVACVQGDAHGMGAALAGCADITLIADTARLSFPEVEHDIAPTLAMSAVYGSMTPKALTYLVYTATTLNASEAVAAGLGSAVLPGATFRQACDTVIASLARRPRVVLTTIKAYNSEARDLSGAQASVLAGHLMALTQTAL